MTGGECEEGPLVVHKRRRALWQVKFELPVVIKVVVLKAENQGESMSVWGEPGMHRQRYKRLWFVGQGSPGVRAPASISSRVF